MKESKNRNNIKKKSVFREYAEAAAIAILLALFIRTFVIQAFKIPTGSMIPTLRIGDRLLANKFIYRFKEPERGEVIIFKSPIESKKYYIKRLVGLPGEELEINF